MQQSIFDQSYDEDNDNDNDSDSIDNEDHPIRIQTAPAKPITDQEEFKRSNEHTLLESAFIRQGQLVQKDFQKYDLDSAEGQRICRKYLSTVEKMCQVISGVFHPSNRPMKSRRPLGATGMTSQRPTRSSTNKGNSVIQLRSSIVHKKVEYFYSHHFPGFPHLYVNGQKYVFPEAVLEAGSQLIEIFFKVQHVIRHTYSRTCQETVGFSSGSIKREISKVLEEFDQAWATFEKVFYPHQNPQLYVNQLMQIESEARKLIQEAIEIDKEITSIEIREKLKGKILMLGEEYINLKKKLCSILAKINSVANIEGKQRDDLGGEILLEAEGIIRRISKEQSKAVRTLAEIIKRAQTFIKVAKIRFQRFRDLMKKYEANIEMVDPQLKNNSELVEILILYENSWEKGLHYFLQNGKCNQLIFFSHIIETTAEKYPEFACQIDERDADIFISIPCLLVLKYLEHEDKKICEYFLPQIGQAESKERRLFEQLADLFKQWKIEHTQLYEYHNILEKVILGITLDEQETKVIEGFQQILSNMVQKIKLLAIDLQRFNANEWNQFIDAAINNQ